MLARFFLFATLLQLSSGYPAVAGIPIHYNPGTTYKYVYSTQTLLNEAASPRQTQAQRDVGFSLKTHVELTPVWNSGEQMLVKLAVSNPRLHSVARDKIEKDLKGLPRLPIYFEWTSGKVARVFAAADDPTLTVNIKKGVISLFQLHGDNGERVENLYGQDSKHDEKDSLRLTQIDASGECTVVYKASENTITKTKTGCKNIQTVGEFKNVNPLLEPSIEMSSQTVYQVAEDVIKAASAAETFSSTLNLDHAFSTTVAVKQDLSLEGILKGRTVKGANIDAVVKQISKQAGLKLYDLALNSNFQSAQCTQDCESPVSVVEKVRASLLPESQASAGAAEAYADLVAAFRTASRDVISAVLRDSNNADIIEAVQDAVTGAQTAAGQAALMDVLDFSNEYDIRLPERYLLAVAFATHPSQQLLSDLFELFQKAVPSEKLRESVGEALGAVLYTYCRMDHWNDQIVKDIQRAMLDKMAACLEAEVAACVPMYLRALMNAGLPETIPVLLERAENSPVAAVAETAVKALRRMGKENLDRQEVRSTLKRIFHQRSPTRRGYDSAVRTRALNLLLDSALSRDELRDILRESQDPWNTDYALYIQARLYNLMEINQEVNGLMREILREPEFQSWHFLAPRGKALAFTGYMAKLEQTPVAATYFMYTENSRAGIMKRSGMDVSLLSPVQDMPIYNFGIFAAGLEGLLGEEVEPGQEDVEATAGISLDLIDVSLRPISFFTGQSGLMSAVWNAPSEPMSALTGNLLMLDHAERLHLQNGLVVEVDVTGAVSMDLSGALSISLWNKNCKSLINNKGALAVRGSVSIVTSSFRAGVTYAATSASVIDFQTDVDFYDGIKMCLQMGRPDFHLQRQVTKFEHARGFRRGYVATITRVTSSPAVSFPLPKPNNKQCRALLADQ